MYILRRLAFWFVPTIPLLAGLSTFQLDTEGGITISGLAWVAQLLVALLLLAASPMLGIDLRAAKYWWAWGIWCAWIWLSLLWCNSFSFRHAQEAAQLCMPFVVGLVASFAVTSRADLKRLFGSYRIMFVFLAFFALIYVSGVGNQDWLEQRARATALAAVLVGCVFLADMPRRYVVPLIGWTCCLLITFFTESRMATLSLLAVTVFHPGFRSKWWNVGMICAAPILAIVIFNTSTFQERFFPETGQGTLQDVMEGSFISQGRFESWPYIWDEAWRRPTLGAGVGTAYDFVPTVWDEVHYVHNDYLRIGFELGLIGLGIFAVVVLWQLFILYRCISQSDGIVRTAFTAAWLGIWAMLISSITDNTIVYNVFYTDPLFAILGAAYGVALAENPLPALLLPTKSWTQKKLGYGSQPQPSLTASSGQ